MPTIAVIVVVGITAGAGLLARRLPWWACGTVCAAGAAITVLVWPYEGLSDFGWAVVWATLSGTLAVALLSAFLFGAVLGNGSPSGM